MSDTNDSRRRWLKNLTGMEAFRYRAWRAGIEAELMAAICPQRAIPCAQYRDEWGLSVARRVPAASEQAASGIAEALRTAGLHAQVQPWLGGYSVIEVSQRFTPKRSQPKSGRLMR